MTTQRTDPLSRFWRAAGQSAAILMIVTAGLRTTLLDTGIGNPAEFVVGIVIGTVVLALAFGLCRLVASIFRPFPSGALTVLAALAGSLWFLSAYSPAEILRTALYPDDWSWPLHLPHGFSPAAVLVVLTALAAAIGMARSNVLRALSGQPRWTLLTTVAVLFGVGVVAILSLVSDGKDPFPSEFRTPAADGPGSIPDPSATGSYTVLSLSYGAGENRRRPRFGEDRDLLSRTVDASALLPEWKGVKKKMRETYWGFGLEHAPLNGLVWAPDGDGPFPLVLIVHGNHGMEDFSDPGYAYLGELLASRGFIVVSVDENYINGSWSGDFRGKEMPTRAWLLLEHLSLWRDWNAERGHRFAGRVDMDNIALVGHSRGGEAVPIAYLFNQLPHYPDDATVPFDYGFSIRSLVAIAQVDQRYHRRVEIDNVNFLALQGSYDSDEPAFHGLRQFNRIDLDPDRYRFKAGIYIHGANHGQFNSTWGRKDLGPPGAWLLNLAPLMSGEDQRQVVKVYLSAFLEATLLNDRRYLPLFRDPRAGSDWLPEHAYVNQFMDSGFIPIATFDDDLDVTTATADGATISTTNVALWREEELRHRDERLQGSNAVVLGWREGSDATYRIELPVSFWRDVAADASLLTLSVSGSTEKVPADDDDERDDAADEDDDSDQPLRAPAFIIEATNEQGRVRQVDSAEVAALAPPLKVQYLKSERRNKASYKSEWEPVLQHFEVPLAALTEVDEAGQLIPVRTLVLRFGNGPEGVVIIDDIGVRPAPPRAGD